MSDPDLIERIARTYYESPLLDGGTPGKWEDAHPEDRAYWRGAVAAIIGAYEADRDRPWAPREPPNPARPRPDDGTTMKTTARTILVSLAVTVIWTGVTIEGTAHGWASVAVAAAIITATCVGTYLLAHLIWVAMYGELPPSALSYVIRKLRRKP